MKNLQQLLFYLLVLIASLLIVITLTSLIYNSSLWFLQVLNFPRLEVLIGLAICLVIALVYPKKRTNLLLIAGLVMAIGIQAYIVLPYTFLGKKVVESASSTSVNQLNVFSIMLANVLITNRHSADLLKIIASKDPTFVLTMEVNHWWISQLSVLKNKYPYCITYPADNAYGMALYSKLPLNEHQILFLNHDKVPSFNISLTLPGGSDFQFVTIHPVAPVPSKYPTNIGGKEVALLKAGRLVAEQIRPTIVAGDFNDVGWSHNTEQFATISGLRDVRYGRGMYNTFDADSWLFRWPLDYVFVSSQFKVLTVERLPRFGSDHFPYYVQLVLQP